LYVTGKNDAASVKVKPVGDTIQRGPTPTGYFGSIAERGETGVPVSTTLTAYDPATQPRVIRRCTVLGEIPV